MFAYLVCSFESVLPVRERAETDGDEVLVNSYDFSLLDNPLRWYIFIRYMR